MAEMENAAPEMEALAMEKADEHKSLLGNEERRET